MKILFNILSVLIVLAISPLATAQIYKCDGPDGPIYSDQECGPNAASVELAETSGISGVSDETKAELAQRRAQREEARTNTNNANTNTSTNINYQFNTANTEPAGRWQRPYRKPGSNPGDRPANLPATGPRPAKSTTVKRK